MVPGIRKKSFSIGYTALQHFFNLPQISTALALFEKGWSKSVTGKSMTGEKQIILCFFGSNRGIGQGKCWDYCMSCCAHTTGEPENIEGLAVIPFLILSMAFKMTG